MRSSRRRLSDDAGVTAAVFALILPAVIAMQAFVVDLAIFLSVARHAQMVADTLVLD